MCLSHSYDWCVGATIRTDSVPGVEVDGTTVDLIMQDVTIGSWVALGINWASTRFAWVAQFVGILGTPGEKAFAKRLERKVGGKCYSVWDRMADIGFGDCNDATGVQWRFEDLNKSDTQWRAWNDTTNDEITTGAHLSDGEYCWDASAAEAAGHWHTWTDYTY